MKELYRIYSHYIDSRRQLLHLGPFAIYDTHPEFIIRCQEDLPFDIGSTCYRNLFALIPSVEELPTQTFPTCVNVIKINTPKKRSFISVRKTGNFLIGVINMFLPYHIFIHSNQSDQMREKYTEFHQSMVFEKLLKISKTIVCRISVYNFLSFL